MSVWKTLLTAYMLTIVHTMIALKCATVWNTLPCSQGRRLVWMLKRMRLRTTPKLASVDVAKSRMHIGYWGLCIVVSNQWVNSCTFSKKMLHFRFLSAAKMFRDMPSCPCSYGHRHGHKFQIRIRRWPGTTDFIPRSNVHCECHCHSRLTAGYAWQIKNLLTSIGSVYSSSVDGM